jgi:hypothetical protein
MKFMMTYNIPNECWDKAVSRFLKTGGPAPEGAKLLGRWHAAGGRNGFILVEGNDVAAIYRFAAEWNDVCDLVTTPIIEDEAAAAVLSSTHQS